MMDRWSRRRRDCRFIAGNNMGKVRVGFNLRHRRRKKNLVYRVAGLNLPSSVSRAWGRLFVYSWSPSWDFARRGNKQKAGVSCGVK